ncbi:peroxiredoxin [Roseovarius sp. TE539]|uniref:peroxiredoxin n=1 Tax=Roseovarius sp. TE539 TaxID=2249812 RepID=UPI000DE044A7|nr:peroxiredoxin [Roseovarius sp. TE539]RBI74615.1 peroxiredoxin [Roseovarius sp. TE539]
MPETAETAPDFTLPRDGGEQVSLSSLSPAPAVLFFYPRDDTSGCTKEALAFTALARDFADAGVTVLGISKDTVSKHEKFRDKHGISVPLLSDAEGTVCEDYGVWKEKSMYGKTFFGIERSTFLIGGDGRIARVWRKVKVPGHAEEVLEAARQL